MSRAFNTLRFRISLASVVLVALSVVGVVFYMQWEMGKITRREQYKNAQDLLQAVTVSVANQYENILFHKHAMLSMRKEELRSVVGLAHASLQGYYEQVRSGKLSEQDAQELAIREVRRFRYKDDVGYIWINDVSQPFPEMIMHPTLPHLDGNVLDDSEFNCAQGTDKNLFVACVDAVVSDGSGFVDYLWPKPTSDGLTKKQPKISFVRHFAPWGWVIGSGLYVDGFERQVDQHIDAVLCNLNETYGEIKIADSGYIFVFTGHKKLLYHPVYMEEEVVNLINPATGNNIFDDLIGAAHTDDGIIEYVWDKPLHNGDFCFKKTAYVNHFEPLDWYIGSSFYNSEIEAPARQLRQKALFFSVTFLVVAVVLALYVAHGITRPLEQVVSMFAAGAQGDYSVRLPVKRSHELALLAKCFNDFMAEIDRGHQQLSASENRFRILFEKSLDARMIIEDNRFTECNEAGVKMLHGKSVADVIGKHPSEFSPEFQPDGRRSDEKATEILASIDENGYVRFPWQHMRVDGEEFPGEIELTLIPYQNKLIVHVLWRDLSQQKKMEQELAQAQKMETVGNLAGGLAHDFNNILTGIVGTVSLLQLEQEHGTLDDELLREYLETMEQAGSRAAAMVQQLLALSRKQETLLLPTDLNLALTHVCRIAQNSFDKSVQLDCHLWPSSAQILADSGQIEQVLLNCCVNGAHAMTTMCSASDRWGGTLQVSICKISDIDSLQQLRVDVELIPYWCVSIRDYGVGMDEETLEKVFTPFFTTKKKDEGSGLGLSMVYNIIKRHGGFVDIDSSPGKGTTVKIFLPENTDVCASNETDASEGIALSSEEGLILIVDDESMMRDVGSRILHKFGYEVLLAESGVMGVSIYQEHMQEISLVLLDMAMPGMSGRETYLELKRIDPDVKVLLVSGYSQDSRVQEVLNLGVCGFIQKPYLLNTLITEVNRVVKG